METKSIATIAGAAAAGGVLAFAGLSLANASTGASQQAPTSTNPQMAAGQYGGQMRGGPGGMHGTPVTGETLQKVTDAVLAQYPDATVDSAEEEGDGYEAHVTKADGTKVHVTLDSNFAITGEHTGPPMGGGMGGPGGMHGTPVTGETLQKVTDAVLAQYPDATVDSAEEEGDGYEAHVTKADGTKVHVTLDSNFAITGEHTGPPMGMGGKGPHGEKPLKGAKAKKVRAAALQRIKGGTVVRVEKDSDGVYEAHVLTTKGRPVIVEVNKRFKVTGVERLPAMAGHRGAPPAAAPSGTGTGA